MGAFPTAVLVATGCLSLGLATGARAQAHDPTRGRQTIQYYSDGTFRVTRSENDLRPGYYPDRFKAWILDPSHGGVVGPLLHQDRVSGAVFSPDGKHVLTASSDRTAAVWDAVTGKRLFQVKHFDWVEDAAYSPDGTRFVTASNDERAIIWDARTGQKLLTLQHEGTVSRATFSTDGEQVLTISTEATLWDARTGLKLREGASEEGFASHDPYIHEGKSKLSPDGRTLLTLNPGRLTIREARTGREVRSVTIGQRYMWVEFGPDGNRLLLIRDDYEMVMLDVHTGLKTPLRWK